ncbi:MAG: hypothetical protein K2X43_14770 [Hyphomonadaceae bacterium]|jgi:hypothetical protein|nr:hypothetical protein [Hyphomonadaceae bacterium]
MSVASPSEDMRDTGGSLPAFVERAREDAQCRAALARVGYRQVRAAYAEQLRADADAVTFRGLERESLSPPMDLVRDWLKGDRRRNLSHARWTFLGTMLATIVTGLAFAAAYSILG